MYLSSPILTAKANNPMKSKEALYHILRKTSLIPVIICTALIQNSAGGASGIGVFLLVPLSVSIAMFEHEFSGMLYGLLCGILWDLSSAIPDGIYALYFTVFACLAGLLTHYLLRNTLISAFVLNISGTLGVCILNFIFNCLAKDATDIWNTIKFFYIPSFLLTVAVIPFFYFPVRFLEKKIRTKTII